MLSNAEQLVLLKKNFKRALKEVFVFKTTEIVHIFFHLPMSHDKLLRTFFIFKWKHFFHFTRFILKFTRMYFSIKQAEMSANAVLSFAKLIVH